MMLSTSFRLIAPRPVWVFLALTLTACGSGKGELEDWVAEVKARKSTQIEPIPQIRQYEAFAYDPGERRSPFVIAQPDQTAVAGDGPRPDLNRNREPLEEFPLDALEMLGIIQISNSTFALISAPDGIIHRVSVGNYLGQNYGRVTAISEVEVALAELVPDGFGSWVQRPASLAQTE